MHYGLDNDSRCKFCSIGYESSIHVFAKCLKLEIVWDFFDEVMGLMNINYTFARQRNLLHRFDIMNLPFCNGTDFQLLVYLNTIINHQIWKCRNECVHENAVFDYNSLISKIMRSVGARKNFQRRMMTEKPKVPRLDDLFVSMLTIRNITYSIDNG